ncbi:hypothetical protein [Nitrososphaera sp.]|uniref:hypothetical protein n=1 Tax=Nitrososphaera sp. TaxID=1971748 RepID=UPI00183390DB|nr:hypothetical protein [Nitrososphaera sp.]NWG37052.1 hypothetical protein [Nitrososphaera sp.]
MVKKTGKKEKSVRNGLAKLHQRYSSLTMNQVAQVYALERGLSVRSKLTPEEKKTFPHLDIQKPTTIIKKTASNDKKRQVKQFIKYDTVDPFIRAHIDEVNKCYTFGAYTAAFILCRKIIENLLTDIIRKKFPQNTLANIELYFDTSRRRTRDFSEILKNLRTRANDFGAEKTLLERILTKADVFKDDANDKAHSWYHIVKRPKELEDAEVQSIIDMISTLEKKI